LEQRGFDVVSVRDISSPATPDPVSYDLAKREDRIVITRDHDFLNILLYPPAQTPGIIVVKVQRLTAKAINALLLDFLSRVSEPQIKNALVVLELDLRPAFGYRSYTIKNALVVLEPHRYRVLR
jgi:predicted nuclease of predicted toxin-antitoxin system